MLQIEQIEKSYKTNNVLRGVNFKVKKGEIKALIGENGAGKSTLIEIICGIKKADHGNIFIDNINVKNKKQSKLIKKKYGYMPQTFSLYQDLSVEENLIYTCAVYGIDYKNNVKQIMDICHLTDKKDVLAQNLSGGYKQLLSMASAIIHKPELLILDEPTSAMDPIFRKKFWDIVKQINESGTTILLITHYIEELLSCDSFACLTQGKIAYEGKIDEFRKGGFINIEEILLKFKLGEVNGQN